MNDLNGFRLVTTRIQRWAEHRQMPWLGGGGSTAEVAVSPPGDGEFDWRISIADVTGDGPFSTLPGVDRTIVNLGDVRMALTVDGVPHELERFRPFAFDGGSLTSCAVSGPTRDLNLMTRRGRAHGELTVHRVAERLILDNADEAWLVVLDGDLRIGDPEPEPLRPGDAALVTGPALLVGMGVVAQVRARRR